MGFLAPFRCTATGAAGVGCVSRSVVICRVLAMSDYSDCAIGEESWVDVVELVLQIADAAEAAVEEEDPVGRHLTDSIQDSGQYWLSAARRDCSMAVLMLDVRCLLCFKASIADPGRVAAGTEASVPQAFAGKAEPRCGARVQGCTS